MKAHQVTPEVNTIPEQDCCECGKHLKAPWARVEGGKKWVCSSNCELLYDGRKYQVDVMAALGENNVADYRPNRVTSKM